MPRKNQAVEPTAEKINDSPVRVGYTIDQSTDGKIKAAALQTGRSLSDLANDAIAKAYAGYYVVYRVPNGAPKSGEPETTA
jgi:hypothetical protein